MYEIVLLYSLDVSTVMLMTSDEPEPISTLCTKINIFGRELIDELICEFRGMR